jgi:hypothetical protein
MTKPVELIEATAGFELHQITSGAVDLPPEPFGIVADACTVLPDTTGFVGRVTDRGEDAAVAVAVNVTEPAPAEDAVTV